MHAPTRELLRQDHASYAHPPTVPKLTLEQSRKDNPGGETQDYAVPAGFYRPPVQGIVHAVLNPDLVEAPRDEY